MPGKLALMLGIALTLAPALAAAQTPTSEHRRVIFADLGYARTLDDEGVLGSGASLSGGFGFRLTPGKTIQGIVDYVSYNRDVEWLTFDGRVIFVGAEMAFQSNRPKVRPFVTVGVGVFDDQGVWIPKRQIGPTERVSDPPITRNYTLAAMTSSGGIDIRVSEQASVRIGVRFHGLLDTGDDLAPHTIFRPSIGGVWRW
jgi:hypothetical protein